MMVLTVAAIVARGGEAIGPGSLWFQGLLLAAWWLYFTWCWTHGGQTIGMRAWRLVLQSTDGAPIGWGRASGRFLAAILSMAPLGLGYWWIIIDRDRSGWHDHLSRTRIALKTTLAQTQDG